MTEPGDIDELERLLVEAAKYDPAKRRTPQQADAKRKLEWAAVRALPVLIAERKQMREALMKIANCYDEDGKIVDADTYTWIAREALGWKPEATLIKAKEPRHGE